MATVSQLAIAAQAYKVELVYTPGANEPHERWVVKAFAWRNPAVPEDASQKYVHGEGLTQQEAIDDAVRSLAADAWNDL